MKSNQAGTGGSRKDGGFSQTHQQYSGTQNNGVPSSQTPGALANYTLPGVIGYLTSEFTSLERFRIMTNLEKSEMKYRIQQLTSELNSVRFINEKQALRIKLLEEKLEHATSAPAGGTKEENSTPGTEISATSIAMQEVLQSERLNSDFDDSHLKSGTLRLNAEPTSNPESTLDIPHIDLEFLRNSRRRLNHSIREIVSLLEPPSSVDVLEAHSGAATQSDFEDLVENSKRLALSPGHDDRVKAREDVFARYTLGKEDLLSGQKISFESDEKLPKEPAENDQQELSGNTKCKTRSEHGLTDESDTETVTFDEPDLIGILSNDADKKSPSV